MGEIIAFGTMPRPRARRPESEGPAEILFFTGVRYCREPLACAAEPVRSAASAKSRRSQAARKKAAAGKPAPRKKRA